MSNQQPLTHLQVPCAMCGALTDLPAVWTCACGQYRICNRSPCRMRIPILHRDGRCASSDYDSAQGAVTIQE
jgi:hypothetical protein